MRILLVTGKGGVGKTTVAAATALRVAAQGHRTVVCSTDPAHSLADVFGVPLGDVPTTVAPGLQAQQLDARTRLEEAWGAVREHLVAWLDWVGADPVEAEELAVVPGLEEVFALADIKAHADSGDCDALVVDCAPTAETLRLLSLPDVLSWYLQRVLPPQRRAMRTLRPLLTRVVAMPFAGDEVFAALDGLSRRLDGVRELLTDPEVTSARLVVNPEQLVVAEARRTFTYLSLFGYDVDSIIVNRVLPAAVSDPWFDGWRASQRTQLEAIATAFEPVPVITAELERTELVGTSALDAFGRRLYGDADPSATRVCGSPWRVDAREGALVLSLPLPDVGRDEVELGRRDDELLVAVGPYRRSVVLPDSLQRRAVGAARLDGGRLEVDFVEA